MYLRSLELPVRLRDYSPNHQSELLPVYFSFWTCKKLSRVVCPAVDVAAQLCNCVREVLASNLSWDTPVIPAVADMCPGTASIRTWAASYQVLFGSSFTASLPFGAI